MTSQFPAIRCQNKKGEICDIRGFDFFLIMRERVILQIFQLQFMIGKRIDRSLGLALSITLYFI